MKKICILGLGLAFCLLLSITAFTGFFPSIAYASAENNTDVNFNIKKISKEVFNDAEIQTSEFLYNLDESQDFFCVSFSGSGYAIFLKNSLELLEYSLQDRSPYQSTQSRKYYCGPQNYYYKEADQFVNSLTNESFTISAAEAKSYSQDIR